MTMSALRRTAGMGLAVLLAGCAAATKVSSNKAPDADPWRKRVFVRSDLLNSRVGASFGPAFAQAFSDRLTEILRRCGAEATVLNVTGLELEQDDPAKAIISYKPDTIMVLRKERGTVSTEGTLLSATLFVDLYDSAKMDPAKPAPAGGTLKPIWRASFRFSRGSTLIPIESRGRTLAEDVTNRMKDDGFFPDCPKVEASPKSAGSRGAEPGPGGS